MSTLGVKFTKGQVQRLDKENEQIKATMKLVVDGKTVEGQGVYDTVLMAVARTPEVKSIGLEQFGIKLDNGLKIIVDAHWQTSIPNVFAIGDIVSGGQELTPLAIKEGELVAKGLANGEWNAIDYQTVPMTVFTPIEYSCCGLAEDKAIEKFGIDNVNVYHSAFRPLEWNFIFDRPSNLCYVKTIVEHTSRKILGLHFLGPNAGEVMQGFAIAVRLGIKFEDLQNTIGIHPTCAEEIVKLKLDKKEFPDPK